MGVGGCACEHGFPWVWEGGVCVCVGAYAQLGVGVGVTLVGGRRGVSRKALSVERVFLRLLRVDKAAPAVGF